MKKYYYKGITEKLNNIFDIKQREISTDCGIIYIFYSDSMTDSKFLSEYVIAPLGKSNYKNADINYVKSNVLAASSVSDVKDVENAIEQILSGSPVLLFSFLDEMISIEAKGFVKRSIQPPITEQTVKGSREGNTEVAMDNVALLRRRIKNPNFKLEKFTLGSDTKTTVIMCYLEGAAPVKLVDYIRKQITSIDKRTIINANEIEEKLKCKNTAFDTVGYTEKPDIAASKILEGRVGIIIDGTPFIITAPYFFVEYFHTPDEYAQNIYYANAARLLRWFAFGVSTLLPAFYVAIITYHFKLVPILFVLRISIARAGVPFPTVIEVFMLMIFFQISREAGVRLPQPIGQSMSIVGALILGDATVGAGLASQSTLIIVALSAISSFIIPKLYAVLWMWSMILVVFAAACGLPGFYMGFIIFVSHVASLNSCGYPYLFPLGTMKKYKYRDLFTRNRLNDISNELFDGDEIQ